jgi:hypothetical protein
MSAVLRRTAIKKSKRGKPTPFLHIISPAILKCCSAINLPVKVIHTFIDAPESTPAECLKPSDCWRMKISKAGLAFLEKLGQDQAAPYIA